MIDDYLPESRINPPWAKFVDMYDMIANERSKVNFPHVIKTPPMPCPPHICILYYSYCMHAYHVARASSAMGASDHALLVYYTALLCYIKAAATIIRAYQERLQLKGKKLNNFT